MPWRDTAQAMTNFFNPPRRLRAPAGPVPIQDVLASQMRYDHPMKTATLPSIRVEPEFREQLEASLKEGETISEFIEGSLRASLRRRNDQAAFVARGLASLEEARRTGVTYDARAVVRELEQMLAEAKDRKAASRRK